MLGDSASLRRNNVGMADSIQKRSLAVVDVTHNNHNRSPRNQVLIGVLTVVNDTLFDGNNDFLLNLSMKLHSNEAGRVKVDDIVYRGHNSHHHEFFDNLSRRSLKPAGKLANSNTFRNQDGNRTIFTLKRNPTQPFSLGFFSRIPRFASLLRLLSNLLLPHSIINFHLL